MCYLKLLLFAQLFVAHHSVVDKVSIRYHTIISQPGSESPHLAALINSQTCLFNVDRQYEITNEEFEHTNDSKFPKSKMMEHLLSVVTSSPEKVVKCISKEINAGDVMMMFESEDPRTHLNSHAMHFESRDHDVTLAKFLKKNSMRVIVAFPRNIFDYYLSRVGVPGFTFPQYCVRSDKHCEDTHLAAQAAAKKLVIDMAKFRAFYAEQDERQRNAMHTMSWLVDVEGVNVLYVPLEQLVDHVDETGVAIAGFLGGDHIVTAHAFHKQHKRVAYDYSKVFENWEEVEAYLKESCALCRYSAAQPLEGVPPFARSIGVNKNIPSS
jgi:hypothetical protein